MEKSLDLIMKKAKNYFATYPEPCVGIMNSLGNSLTSYESFKEFLSFVGGIVAN